MKRALVLAPLIILALTLSDCTDSSETTKVAAAAPVARPAAPTSAPDESVFVASGPVVVENQVDVAALREGVVVSILAEPNTHVRKASFWRFSTTARFPPTSTPLRRRLDPSRMI